ncbi:MAG: peptide chain release factor 1 [Chloroflexi bacterium]|nr:peptide chain release factor 1 [Chloroflexota bacterium]
MLERLAGIEARYEELERLMADPTIMTDYTKVSEYAQERSGLTEIVENYRQYKRQLQELDEAKALRDEESDADLRALAEEEIATLEGSIQKLYGELRRLLLPSDPRDDKNVFVEIRAGAGGDEAGLFAADLFRLYARYAEARNWKVDVVDENNTGIGGYKEIVFQIKGKGAYSRLKFESGVHRVQRVPATESQGRIHTSTVTVAVLAEMDEVDIHISPKDLRIDTYNASGAGGQNVQKNDNAVRITHLPTGIVAQSQDERSQGQNRQRAMQVLIARLYEMEAEKQRRERESERRDQVGTGDRSEKIRTYNYPQNRVTDHRINMTSYNLAAVMNGDIDEFIDGLIMQDQAEKLAAGA